MSTVHTAIYGCGLTVLYVLSCLYLLFVGNTCDTVHADGIQVKMLLAEPRYVSDRLLTEP